MIHATSSPVRMVVRVRVKVLFRLAKEPCVFGFQVTNTFAYATAFAAPTASSHSMMTMTRIRQLSSNSHQQAQAQALSS